MLLIPKILNSKPLQGLETHKNTVACKLESKYNFSKKSRKTILNYPNLDKKGQLVNEIKIHHNYQQKLVGVDQNVDNVFKPLKVF